MRLLVLGANGLIGSNVVDAALNDGREVVGTFHSERPEFEITLREHDIRDGLKDELEPSQFDAVVNCAAMTDVDECEQNRNRARTVNAIAPRDLAEACAESDTQLVHFSTDYVFDGGATEPYGESAEPNPVQVYGESKLAGERWVSEVHPTPLVLRLSFVYGIHRSYNHLSGFPAWVVGKLRASEPVQLLTDQYVTPSRAGQVALTLLELLTDDRAGTYHVASKSCLTPYEFGVTIAEQINVDNDLIEEGTQSDIDQAAERPSYTCLSVKRIENVLNREQPTFYEDVRAIGEALQGH